MGATERKTIGIIYNFRSTWMGGLIYILNAIKILNWLDDEEKPRIILFYRKDLKRFVDEIEYPYLEAVEWEFPSFYKGYINSWLTLKNQFVEPIIRKYSVDAIFPLRDYPVRSRGKVKLVSWYADLQHKHYPHFFNKKYLWESELRTRLILWNNKDLVVSSEAVRDDFNRFYRASKASNLHVFHFASVIDSFSFPGRDIVTDKFKLPAGYFLVSNQFHKHKNHKIVLEALIRLKSQGCKPVVVMTGKIPDDTSMPHIAELKSLIADHELQGQVFLLGLLAREEQLCLMKYAQAVIQPSLFEGWSTVIEDAISLQTPVIASDIDVNVEQLGSWGVYFDPHSPNQLASAIKEFPERTDFDKMIFERYDERVRKAARSFISIFS
ncbi:MAG: glycosyltransferase family 1 protein [Imperialibacter sp.]|uniref:glycosyltransferase family 4 protein n=1 Tax=Imperialibacter sp. TaxID=2038411 RepID=UPI0032F08D79